jgi:hypothetical protein
MTATVVPGTAAPASSAFAAKTIIWRDRPGWTERAARANLLAGHHMSTGWRWITSSEVTVLDGNERLSGGGRSR